MPDNTSDTGLTAKYWGREAKPGPWDAVIIGSGMGGMTAAALLAKLGRRVLVLEQHYVPGGFTHTFARRGYRWDVGVHAVGEMTDRQLPGRLLGGLTDGRLKWAPLGEVYDTFHLPDGTRIDFPDNPRQFRENLVAAFPAGAAAIDEYLRLVRQVGGDMRAYYLTRLLPPRLGALADRLIARRAQRHLATTVADVVSRLTDDRRLRTMLTAQWGYYGTAPSRASFAMQAGVVGHFMHGGYYPVGGSDSIARELLRTVAEADGWTRVRADVREIIVERGRAVGVRLTDGEEIRAPLVMSAVGAPATVARLLPETERRAAWTAEVAGLRPGPAHVCLYLGFKGDIRAAGAGPKNLWFYESWDSKEDVWRVAPDGDLGTAPVLYASFPSLKDPLHDPGHELRHTGELVTFVPWETFLPWRDRRWMRRGADYERFKVQLKEALLEHLFRYRPGLRPLLDYAELSTPVSTDHFMRSANGSIYGLDSTPERYACRWLRARTPIPGLFMAGVDVAAPGVVGGAVGGMLAVASAKPLAAVPWLRRNVL